MLAVLTSVGCSQRGEPFLQKLSRNNFNRRQLTLVGSGFVYSFILFTRKKAAKNMDMKNLNICWRTCCCCKLLQRGSRLHSRGWKQRWSKVWQSNSKDSPQRGCNINRSTTIFGNQVDNVSQCEGGQHREYQEPYRPGQGLKASLDCKRDCLNCHSHSHVWLLLLFCTQFFISLHLCFYLLTRPSERPALFTPSMFVSRVNDFKVLPAVFFSFPLYMEFFKLALPVDSTERKLAFSQPELLFLEIFHLRKPLVGSLAYFLFGTEQGGAS